MGLFCPKCGSLLRSVEKKGRNVMGCSCGYSEEGCEEIQLTERGNKEEELAIVERDEEIYPLIKAECPNCEATEAFFWTVQTRAGDEPETKFLKCKKCKHTWRDYD